MTPEIAGLLGGLGAGGLGSLVVAISNRKIRSADVGKLSAETAAIVMNELRTERAEMKNIIDEQNIKIANLETNERSCLRRVTFLLGLVNDSGISVPDDILNPPET